MTIKNLMAEVLMRTNLPYPLFTRGKTRDVYDLKDDTLSIVATDRVSAFDRVMHEGIPEKGISLTRLSEYWFKLTQHIIPNHYVETLDERSIRVKKAERVDIEWIVRGNLYGSLARAYSEGKRELYGLTLPDGLRLADQLPDTILTATTKAESGHDQPITREEAIDMGLVRDGKEWDTLADATFELYEFYRGHAREKGLIIPDFKIEFGRVDGEYMQIDEPPNHDSARLWAVQFYTPGRNQEGHALDKEFLRQYLLSVGYTGDGEQPHLPELIVDQVSRRCRGATEMLTRNFETVTGVQADISRFGLITVEKLLEEK